MIHVSASTVPVIPGRGPGSNKVPGSRDRYVEMRIRLESESELRQGTCDQAWSCTTAPRKYADVKWIKCFLGTKKNTGRWRKPAFAAPWFILQQLIIVAPFAKRNGTRQPPVICRDALTRQTVC